ncbi:BA3454 family stress response protein [Peribacillus sp. SCS-26]|uniref:BA3454 family stress response protein n=1 Tax=Paraperibacillus marinus TaxID=3115295 RepID=UPI0039063834
MVEVTVTVEYKGKNYMTNVLVSSGAQEEEIFSTALNQVKDQWSPEDSFLY